MKFEPTAESISKHEVPQWYNDAKFGIFIHWSLFSVPAWAPVEGKNLAELSESDDGFGNSMRNSPYADKNTLDHISIRKAEQILSCAVNGRNLFIHHFQCRYGIVFQFFF